MDVEGAMAIPIEFSPIRNRGAEWKHNWKTGTFSGNRSSNEKAAGIGYPYMEEVCGRNRSISTSPFLKRTCSNSRGSFCPRVPAENLKVPDG